MALGHGGAKLAFTLASSPPSSSSRTMIGWPRHVLDASACSLSLHAFRSDALPPNFGVNSSSPPICLLTTSGRTTDQSTDPRHENTITAPMSASRSHGGGVGPSDGDGDGCVTPTVSRV